GDADQRLHFGRAAGEGLGEQRQRFRVDGVEAARGVAARAAEHELHRATEDRSAEAPRSAGLVPVRGVTVARDEPRPDGDVVLATAHEFEQTRKLLRWMLAVGADAPAIGVVVVEGPAVAGGDSVAQALIRSEGVDL